MTKNRDASLSLSKSHRFPHLLHDFDDDFPERVNADYAHLLDTVHLATTRRAQELLLMQSEQGRAIMGNGAFSQNHKPAIHVYRYVNTTIEDVVRCLVPKREIPRIREERQQMIDGIRWWVDIAINEVVRRKHGVSSRYDRSCMLLDERNEPLAGIEYFRHNPVNSPLLVLQGMYLGSCMDSFAWREKVFQKYGLRMGGGECVAVHMPTLRQEADRLRSNGAAIRYNLELLAQNEHDPAFLDLLGKAGIVSDKAVTMSEDGWVQGYVRRKIGHGVSDDAAVLSAGIMLGNNAEERIAAGLGVLLIDAVDTWDKYTPTIVAGGQDEDMGKHIRRRLRGDLGLGNSEEIERRVVDYIYASAIDPHVSNAYPDCSQRRFLEYHDRKRLLYALSAHILYLMLFDRDKPHEARAMIPDLSISFTGVSLNKFMDTYIHRLQEIGVLSKNGNH